VGEKAGHWQGRRVDWSVTRRELGVKSVITLPSAPGSFSGWTHSKVLGESFLLMPIV
jgi:hypothetical protein